MVRAVLLGGWIVYLFLSTCAYRFGYRAKGQTMFRWNASPDYTDLFRMYDLFHSTDFFLRKLGHFLSFAILAFLLYGINGSRRGSFIQASLFAIATELLQLYFERGGRVLDMLINVAGIAVLLKLAPPFDPVQRSSCK